MKERAVVRLGLIGFGEVGYAFARGLRGAGLERITVYDVSAFDGPRSELKALRARETGARLVPSLAELAAEADCILAVVPGRSSVQVAAQIGPMLGPHHLYVDLASAMPRIKQEVADVLAPTKASVAEGALMDSVHDLGYRAPIVASGPGAPAFASALQPWGMAIEVVGETIGAGSAMKMCRSIMMKGLDALLVECAVASSRYGVFEEVFASVSQWMDARSFTATTKFLLTTSVIHARRRAEEAVMSADTLRAVGVDPVMTEASARLLKTVGELGLKDYFGGIPPSDERVAVKLLEERLRA